METLLAVLILVHAPPAFQAQTLGGDVIAGSLVELNAERITVETSDGPVHVELDRLTGLAPALAPSEVEGQPSVWVTLVDGSLLAGSDYTAVSNRVHVALLDGANVELSADQVTAVRFQPQEGAVGEEWTRLVNSDVDGDLLVVRKGEAINYYRGVLKDVTDVLVHFEHGPDVLPVERAKLQGLIYYRRARNDLPEIVCRLVDVDGSQWAVGSIALDGDRLRWTTLTGVQVSRPLAAVVQVDFSQGKVVYLSDLVPEAVEWTPFFGNPSKLEALERFFGPREDRGLRSEPLVLDGREYTKGLALQSRARVVYRLPGPFRRLKATVGIDDAVRPRGNALLRIRGDGRVLLDAPLAGTDPALPVDVDVSGVRRLEILVDFADDLDVADHVDLCELRVVK